MNNSEDRKTKSAMKTAREIVNIPPSSTDPLGMYTGKPIDSKDAVPVQDSDDL